MFTHALTTDAQRLPEERREYASGMERSQRLAGTMDALAMPRMEECALSMGQKSELAATADAPTTPSGKESV